jgi:hypothetical protein
MTAPKKALQLTFSCAIVFTGFYLAGKYLLNCINVVNKKNNRP